MIYSRNCPKCKSVIIHKTESALYLAGWRNLLCRSCSQKGHKVSDESKEKMSLAKIGRTLSIEHSHKISMSLQGSNHPMYGKHHSEEMKKKFSLSHKGQKPTEETKRKLKESNKLAWKDPIKRKKYYDSLLITKWIKVRCDAGQLELLEKWNRLGFNFEPNYQIITDENLFYIDGYDKEHNVVLEFDSKYHNRSTQHKLDVLRQEKIIKSLNPKRFWRFNSTKNIFIECITKQPVGCN